MKKIKFHIRYKPLIDKWIDYLKEHPDEQGEHYLYVEETGYCCLGVLCKLAGYSDKHMSWVEIPSTLECDLDIPKEILEDNNDLDGIVEVLTFMNDGHIPGRVKLEWGLNQDKAKYTFPEIAEFINQRVEYYEEEHQEGD